MNPRQSDMFGGDGPTRRDEGIERVLRHVSPQWHVLYRTIVDQWFERLPPGIFTMEEARACVEPFIGSPHHPNVWGAEAHHMLTKWDKDDRIERVGFRAAGRGAAHARNVVVYRKVK